MFFSFASQLLAVSAGFSAIAAAVPSQAAGCRPAYNQAPKGCPPLSGTFNINNFRYYPENFDWDSKRCLLYASANVNATLMIYNPYTEEQTIIEFPGISYDPLLHTSGVDYHAATDTLYIGAGSGESFVSNGQNVTGPNKLIKFDPETRKPVWISDLQPFVEEVNRETGFKTGGFQDQAEDAEGNSYVIGCFGNLIAKVNGKTGVPEPYYITPKEQMNATEFGMLGVVSIDNGSKLVVTDNVKKGMVTFDLAKEEAEPVDVQLSNMPFGYNMWCDGFYAPAKYDEKVLLCTDNFIQGFGAGAIIAYGSKDGWKSGEYLGRIMNNDFAGANGSTPTALTQIGESIFVNEVFFFDDARPFNGGNRSSFPVVDITKEVDALVQNFV